MRCLTMLLLLPAVVRAQTTAPREFSVDASHSAVGFSIPFLTGHVTGGFDDLRGIIYHDPAAPERSHVRIVIDATSLHTGSRHRDEHLRTSDFFDVAQYPTISFTSERVARSRDGFLVSGPLTMHGVTRTVSIPFRQVRPVMEDPHGSDIVNFEGSLRLARLDFGIRGGSTYNDWFDALRSRTMGDSADIGIELQGWETSFARTTKYDAALARFTTEGLAPTAARLRRLKAEKQDLGGTDWELEQMARTLLARGRAAEALELVALGLQLFPGSVRMQTAAARVYELMNRRSQASAAVALALGLDAADPRALELQRRLRQPAVP